MLFSLNCVLNQSNFCILNSNHFHFWLKSFKWTSQASQNNFSPHSQPSRCTFNIRYTTCCSSNSFPLEKNNRRRALLCSLSNQPVRKRWIVIRERLPAVKGCYRSGNLSLYDGGLRLVSQWEGCETFPWYLSPNYSLRRHEGWRKKTHLNAVVPSPTECLELCGFHISRLIDFQRERLCDFIWHSREVCSLVHCCQIAHLAPERTAHTDRHLIIGLPGGKVMMIWSDNVVFTRAIWTHSIH